ncbi:MAG: hypothetical protein NC181_05545 [Clostridium sp.]|nr:hypothetical protein [Clostridium sp.]MCM1444727.1 hypothetical protein [Candidatus Amulumruptor caecigallinarius]
MNINIKDTIVLEDNKEYVVVSKAKYLNKVYYYLMDIKNHKNFKFCYEEDDYLVEEKDEKILSNLLLLFLKNTINNFK